MMDGEKEMKRERERRMTSNLMSRELTSIQQYFFTSV